jgi:hypothetical protein
MVISARSFSVGRDTAIKFVLLPSYVLSGSHSASCKIFNFSRHDGRRPRNADPRDVSLNTSLGVALDSTFAGRGVASAPKGMPVFCTYEDRCDPLSSTILKVKDILQIVVRSHDVECGPGLRGGLILWKSEVRVSDVAGCVWQGKHFDCLRAQQYVIPSSDQYKCTSVAFESLQRRPWATTSKTDP